MFRRVFPSLFWCFFAVCAAGADPQTGGSVLTVTLRAELDRLPQTSIAFAKLKWEMLAAVEEHLAKLSPHETGEISWKLPVSLSTESNAPSNSEFPPLCPHLRIESDLREVLMQRRETPGPFFGLKCEVKFEDGGEVKEEKAELAMREVWGEEHRRDTENRGSRAWRIRMHDGGDEVRQDIAMSTSPGLASSVPRGWETCRDMSSSNSRDAKPSRCWYTDSEMAMKIPSGSEIKMSGFWGVRSHREAKGSFAVPIVEHRRLTGAEGAVPDSQPAWTNNEDAPQGSYVTQLCSPDGRPMGFNFGNGGGIVLPDGTQFNFGGGGGVYLGSEDGDRQNLRPCPPIPKPTEDGERNTTRFNWQAKVAKYRQQQEGFERQYSQSPENLETSSGAGGAKDGMGEAQTSLLLAAKLLEARKPESFLKAWKALLQNMHAKMPTATSSTSESMPVSRVLPVDSRDAEVTCVEVFVSEAAAQLEVLTRRGCEERGFVRLVRRLPRFSVSLGAFTSTDAAVFERRKDSMVVSGAHRRLVEASGNLLNNNRTEGWWQEHNPLSNVISRTAALWKEVEESDTADKVKHIVASWEDFIDKASDELRVAAAEAWKELKSAAFNDSRECQWIWWGRGGQCFEACLPCAVSSFSPLPFGRCRTECFDRIYELGGHKNTSQATEEEKVVFMRRLMPEQEKSKCVHRPWIRQLAKTSEELSALLLMNEQSFYFFSIVQRFANVLGELLPLVDQVVSTVVVGVVMAIAYSWETPTHCLEIEVPPFLDATVGGVLRAVGFVAGEVLCRHNKTIAMHDAVLQLPSDRGTVRIRGFDSKPSPSPSPSPSLLEVPKLALLELVNQAGHKAPGDRRSNMSDEDQYKIGEAWARQYYAIDKLDKCRFPVQCPQFRPYCIRGLCSPVPPSVMSHDPMCRFVECPAEYPECYKGECRRRK